jgi:AraC-like DNA-binding protein
MLKDVRPAIDLAVTARAGVSRDGQPLSYNRRPAPDLAPWVGRLYATQVDLPEDYTLHSGLFNDASCLRIQLSGEWTAQTATGPMALGRAALIFGPQTRVMPVTVSGSFISIGASLRPGTGHALRKADASNIADRIVQADTLGLDSAGLLDKLDPAGAPEDWLCALEEECRRVIAVAGGGTPDPVSVSFEALAFHNPSASVAEFAQEVGISTRQLTRIVKRDFGMPPKQVLRRARALDMASFLHGVADEAEAEDLILRYFDQAQMTREFTELFGMPPRRFKTTPNPLLTLALESRQARRLDALQRLGPDGARPWE